MALLAKRKTYWFVCLPPKKMNLMEVDDGGRYNIVDTWLHFTE